MNFTKEDVRHIAKLAALEVSDEELERLQKDLVSILEFVDKLKEANAEGVAPTSHVHGVVNAFREDSVRKSFDVKEALSNAPDSSRDSFRVPRII